MQRTWILLFFVTSFSAVAQLKSRIYIDGVEGDELSFVDTLQMNHYLLEEQKNWVIDGHYFAGRDSTIKKDDWLLVYLHKGEKMDAGFTGLRRKNILKEINTKLTGFTNHGFPFATISIDSTVIDGNTIGGVIAIQKGPEIRYDSAYFMSNPKTQSSYLFRMLDIVPGDLFSENDFRSIDRKIQRSPFYSLNNQPDISFQKNLAKVYLDIEEREANSFQGVLGLQQGAEGKSQVIGSVDLDIQNLFRSGKQLKLYWERFGENSQKLDLYYKHPFILGSKISPSFRLDLLKQDTTFLTRTAALGINTFISPTIDLFIGYESTNGTLLSTGSNTVSSRGLADFRRNLYQLSLSQGFFESITTLKEGTAWNILIGAGIRKVDKNLNLDESYYDTIPIETNFFQLDVRAGYQVKIGKRQTFYQEIQSGLIKNTELLTNELYRIGGLNSLRGFNEKNVFADAYLLSRIEARSFFESNSYVFLFYDQLFSQRNENLSSPFGVGLGFSLATSTGQFSFALAVGKSETQSMAISDLKAHFGYITRF